MLNTEAGSPVKKVMMDQVTEDFTNRARIGCTGRGRLPTSVKNGKGAYTWGFRMAETLQAAVILGTLVGPLLESEILFEKYKKSSLGAKLKESLTRTMARSGP